MQKNFTKPITAYYRVRPLQDLKALLLFMLLLVFHAASAQTPTINTTNPSCVVVQQALELTINGSGFDTRTDGNGAKVVVTGTSFENEVVFTPSSLNTSQITVNIPAGDNILANPGALTIAVRQNGTDVSNPVQISVYPTTTTITGPASVCVGSGANTTANYRVPVLAGSTTYSWRILSGPASIASGGTTPEAVVSFNSTSGTVTIEVTVNPNCAGTPASTTTHKVTVNEAPNVTLAPLGTNGTICTNGGVLTLTGGAPAGGKYTVDGIVATTFDPTNALGEHTIVYYFTTPEGCEGSATQKINVIQAPTVSLSQFANVCVNAAAFPLTGGTPANGTYRVDGEPVTEFNPAVAGVGTHTITYTLEQNGCTSIATQTITVLEAPTVSLSEFNNVCSSVAAFPLTGGLPAGGTYAGPGVTNGQFNPATAGAGTHTITYTVTQGGCTSSETQTITVLQAPTVSLEPLANVCSDAGLITLTGGFPASGTYSGRGVTNGQFDPAAAGVGTHTITYTVEQNGCTSIATQSITVVQPPSASITAPIGTQSCEGGTIPLTVTNTAGAAYQWFRDGNEIANANTHNLNADRTGTYSVRITNNGCSVTSAPVEVIILDPATIIAEGPNVQLCTPQTTVLHAVTGYAGYQWYKDGTLISGQNTATLTVTQTGNYYVILNTRIGTCPTVTSAVTRVEVGSAIANNTINATSPVCSGSPVSITGQPATGGSGTPAYQWQISTNGGNSYTDITTDGNTQDYIYTATNVNQTTTVSFRRVVTSGACTSISAPVTVTITPIIVVNPINTNNRILCSGNEYTIVAPQPLRTSGNGTFTFQWQRSSTDDPNSFTSLPNTNTKDYTFNPDFIGTQYFRRIITSGGCSDISGVVPVTVNPVITNNTITPNRNPICANTSVVIQGLLPEGGTGSYKYQWQSGTDNVNFTDISGATTRNYNFSSGNFVGTQYFRRIVTSGPAATVCSNTSNVVSITVNPPITGNDEIITDSRSLCTGTSLIIEAPAATGGGSNIRYKWQSSPDNVNFTDVNNYSVNNQNYLYSPGNFVGEIYFRRVVNSGSGCIDISSKSVKITVQKTSTYTLILNANPFPVCGEAVYTARVYRDVTSVSYPTNPQYGEATVVGGTDVTNQFTFDWWKNDTDPVTSNNSSQITIAAPQSQDYYTVRARPSTVAPTCFLYNNRPDLVPSNRGVNELFSNRIYRGAPIGYSVSIATNVQPSNTVCAGTPVTFTATPNKTNFVNPRYLWYVNGVSTGVTTSTFTSSTLNTSDIVTATFTSDENRCDPITSNAITMLVASPQLLSGGGSYCASDQFGGVTIEMANSQVGITYQLMLGNTKVFFPVPGNGGPISFGYHKYTPGTYSVQASISNGNGNSTIACSPFGSVTVSHTPARAHSVTITPPSELVVGEPATFEAKSTIAGTNPTYRWFVFDFANPSAGFVEQPGANTSTFVLPSVPEGDIEIRVDVQAPNGICVDDADGIASGFTGQIGPLPVELIYLKATKQNHNVVELEWATAMEQNSEGFEVQVSQDAKNYRTLAFVASKAGGNTNEKQVYTFHDKENGKYGTRYYRLMQRDRNGDAEYFGPKAVQIGEETESLSVYPNPFTSEVNLSVNAEEAGTMHVIVTNAIGAKVLERTLQIQKGSSKQKLQFNGSLPQGMYHITTRLNGKTNHLKLLKQ